MLNRRPELVMAIALFCVGAGLLVVGHWQWLMVHLSQQTGTSSSSSRAYNFFSGFGANFGELALIGGLITVVRSHNCHQKGCWRLSRHLTADGYKLCRRCVGKPKSELDLHDVHSDHQ